MSTPAIPPFLLACLRDIVEDPASLCSRSIKSQSRWCSVGNGRVGLCTLAEEGDESIDLFELRALGDFDINNSYFRPDGGWTGPGPFNIEFTKIKARGALIASSIEEFRFHAAAQNKELSSIMTDDELKSAAFNVGPGATPGPSLILAGGGINMGVHLITGPLSTDEDQGARARAQEEQNTALGEEFTSRRLPCGSQASRDALTTMLAGGLHAARPIAVWKADWSRPVLRDDLDDDRVGGTPATAQEAAVGDAVPTMERVRPAMYDRVLRGATVDVRFNLIRQYIKSSKKVMFLADITAIYVLREAPQVNEAKRKASAGNFLRSKRVHFAS